MTKKQNYSVSVIGPDEEYPKDEKVPSTEEFLAILDRQEMTKFFLTVDAKSYKKAVKMTRHLVRKFIDEDKELKVLRAFFILALFNLSDYRFIREMYKEAVKIAPVAQIKLIDVYHASMVLEDDRNFDDRINALAPYIKNIVIKISNDVRDVRNRMDSKMARA